MFDVWNPVYVIFMNDSPEFVWIGYIKDAEEKMEELARGYWERNKWSIKARLSYALRDVADPSDEEAIYKIYRKGSQYYWHIHDVNSNAQSPQG